MASVERGHASDEPAMVQPIPFYAPPEEWTKQAKKIFDTLPSPPIPRLPNQDVTDLTKWQTKPKTGPAEALQNCADALEKYDAEECKAYREEIDTLLVFAGLFSAVVTAFSIESYQWLQSDPNDAIIALLSQIAHPTNKTASPLTPQGLSGAVSTRINAYWFLSLALSLSAALVAIMCKQWVREFERHSGLSNAAQYIGIRQMKLEGFESWRVAGIVAAIPLLLQCALGLFALGLLELLWNLHVTVAIMVLIPTTTAFVFYASTTLLPGIQAICDPFSTFRKLPQCPFKSAQAMLALRLLVLLPIIVHWCCRIPGIGWEFLSTKLFGFWHTELSPDTDMERGESHSGGSPESTQPAADAEEPSVPSAAQAATEPDGAPRVLWRRFVQVWMRREAHPGNDRKSPQGFDAWSTHSSFPARRFRGFATVESPEGIDTWSPHSSSPARRFPGFATMESWLSMDQAFASLRDKVFTVDEYDTALQNHEWGNIPPELFFRGLSWLRDHVHQPEIDTWIFWSLWARTRSVSNWLWSSGRKTRLLYGIHSTFPPDMIDTTHSYLDWDVLPISDPAILLLLYGQHVKIEPSFIAEAFIQHISRLQQEPRAARNILYRVCLNSGTNGDTMLSIVHAIIAHALRPERTSTRLDNRSLLHDALPHILHHPRAVIHPVLACVIAVYLRDITMEGGTFSEILHDVEDLWGTSVQYLGCDQEPNILTVGPSGEKVLYAALAVAIDQCLENIEDTSPDSFADTLVQPGNREVYLDLLTTALGSRDTAMARLELNAGKRAERYTNSPEARAAVQVVGPKQLEVSRVQVAESTHAPSTPLARSHPDYRSAYHRAGGRVVYQHRCRPCVTDRPSCANGTGDSFASGNR